MIFDAFLFFVLFSKYFKIVDFCDEDVARSERHDREAPNKHNRLCDSRSNWEIMREHPDFNGKGK